MKSRIVCILGIAMMLIMSSPMCMAVGFGAYASYDYRISTLNTSSDSDLLMYQPISDIRRTRYGQLGLVLDTNVAKDSIFNYRLNIGLDFSHLSFSDELATPPGISKDVWKIMIENSLGFGIARSESFRLWIGPQVGFGIGFEPSLDSTESYDQKIDNFYEVDANLGLVLGLNLHIGDGMSICGEIGARLHDNVITYGNGFPNSITMMLLDAFANVSIILRANDVFVPPKTE